MFLLWHSRIQDFTHLAKRCGLAVKSTCWSCRGPGFSSQHLNGSSQRYITPIPEDLTPSGLHRHLHTVYWYSHSVLIFTNTNIHLKQKINSKSSLLSLDWNSNWLLQGPSGWVSTSLSHFLSPILIQCLAWPLYPRVQVLNQAGPQAFAYAYIVSGLPPPNACHLLRLPMPMLNPWSDQSVFYFYILRPARRGIFMLSYHRTWTVCVLL